MAHIAESIATFLYRHEILERDTQEICAYAVYLACLMLTDSLSNNNVFFSH